MKCPACGQDSVGMFIDLRRYYSPSHVIHDVNGELTWEGWGTQVDDKIDYLECENEECGTVWSADDVTEFERKT